MAFQKVLGQVMVTDSDGSVVPLLSDSAGSLLTVKNSRTYVVLPSAARGTGTAVASAEFDVSGYSEATAFLDVTAASGTSPTLDVKFQTKDALSGKWFDIAGLVMTQKTAVGTEIKSVASGLGSAIRAVYTIAGTTPSFTFSLGLVVK